MANPLKEETPLSSLNQTQESDEQSNEENTNPDKPEKPQNWSEFFEKSPMNGMPQIIRSTSIIETLIWICVVLGGLGATGYMIYLQVDEFTQFKTNAQVRKIPKPKLHMPAITFCSGSRYLWKKEWEEKSNLLNTWWEYKKIPSEEEITEQQSLSQLYDSTDEFYNETGQPYENFPNFTIFSSTLNEAYTLSDYMIDNGWFSQLVGTNQSSYPVNPVIAMTTTDRKQLKPEAFSVFLSSTYGTCTTIKPKLQVKKAGNKFGMTFMIDTKEEYSSESSSGNMDGGIKFQVHPASEEPNIEEYGVSVGSASQVAVELTKVLNNRPVLPIPVVCSPMLKPLKYFKNYSENACLIECKEEMIYNKCGCRGATFRSHNDKPYCNFTQEVECIIPQTELLTSNETQLIGCMCFAPCKEDSYEQKISYGSYPTKGIIAYWATLLNLNASDLIDRGNQKYLEENTLVLNLYFGTMNEKVITETIKTDISSFLSSVGGQFGLFLGISGGSILIILQNLLTLMGKSLMEVKEKHFPPQSSNTNSNANNNSLTIENVQARLDETKGKVVKRLSSVTSSVNVPSAPDLSKIQESKLDFQV